MNAYQLMDKESRFMGRVASDLLTGNHLLGRPRESGYKEFLLEVVQALDEANKGNQLNERNNQLLIDLSKQFYGGLEDMIEQLNMNSQNVNKSINIS